jgi:hypothetical protein
MSADSDACRIDTPLAQLEQALIEEFVRAHGHDPAALSTLPESERQKLLADASVYASGKLMEVEARSHFLHEIHGTPGTHGAGVDD